MSKLPGSVQVTRALKNVAREVKSSLKLINSQAGKLLQKADYAGAEALVEKAKLVGEFQANVDALRARWKDLGFSVKQSSGAKEQTLLWEYYRPILQALVTNDGNAAATELEPIIVDAMAEKLKAGDHDLLTGNKPRWRVMIKRARKHMVKEGWVEADTGTKWRITKQGRKAAEAEPGDRD